MVSGITFRRRVIGGILCCIVPLCSFAAVLIDDGSTDKSSLYTLSDYVDDGALAYNAGVGGYDITISGANRSSAWYYNPAEITSASGVIVIKFWWEIKDTTVTGDERTHLYLTWGMQTNTAQTLNDPGSNYAEGYRMRVDGRQNYAPDKASIVQKTAGNAGDGLYRAPGSGGVSELSTVTVGAMNPTTYYRAEWYIRQEGGLNKFDYVVYEGATAEFTDSNTIKGSNTYTVASNVIEDGYFGFGFRRENTDAGAEPVATIHRIELSGDSPAVPEPASLALMVMAMAIGYTALRRRLRVLPL